MSRIIKETTVYGGPRTSGYATMATLHQNQSVTAIFKELDFLFVEYDGVNRTKRRGYVLARDVQLQESVRTYTALATNKAIRVVVTSAAVFEGPAFSGYMKLGSFSENAFISFLGIKENDFALVEMKNHAGVVRGYFYANYLRTLSNRVGSIISDTNSTGYLSPLNKFTAGEPMKNVVPILHSLAVKMEISGMQMYLAAIRLNTPHRIPRSQILYVAATRRVCMATFFLSKLLKMVMFTSQKITGQQMILR